ncbi:MAG: hypothetical protein AAFW68_07325, partial [Pseudomonadota bacterium]
MRTTIATILLMVVGQLGQALAQGTNSAEQENLDPSNYCHGPNLSIGLSNAWGKREIELARGVQENPYFSSAEFWRTNTSIVEIPGKFRVKPTDSCERILVNTSPMLRLPPGLPGYERPDPFEGRASQFAGEFKYGESFDVCAAASRGFSLDLHTRGADFSFSVDPCTEVEVQCKAEADDVSECRIKNVLNIEPPVRRVELSNETTSRNVNPPFRIKVAQDGSEIYGVNESYTKEIYVELSASVASSIGASSGFLESSVTAEVETRTGIKFGRTYTDVQSVEATGLKSDGSGGCRDWDIY